MRKVALTNPVFWTSGKYVVESPDLEKCLGLILMGVRNMKISNNK